jgi:drug/metabolite transporter (DMT)-like permease
VALMACAALLWSIAGVVARQLERADSLEATFWRSVFAALTVLAGLALTRRGGTWRSVVSIGRPGLVASACFAAMYICFMVALTTTTVANTLIVSSLSPVFTALLARAVLRYRIPARTWLAIAAAFAGMLWMFGPGVTGGEPRHALGMLIALGVPVAAAVNVVTLTHASARLDLVPTVMAGALVSALLVLPFALPFTATPRDIALLAGLGILQLGLPCMMMVVAARSLSAPEISLLALVEVVAGPVWAWLGAGEVPAGETVGGGAIVLSALVANELVALRGRASRY